MPNSKKLIYIIDDSSSYRTLLKAILNSYGFENVTTFDSALEAMEAMIDSARNNKPLPSLIMMDVVMPGIDGIEATRKIKSDQKFSDIPIIIITVKDDEASLEKAFEAGAADYVIKPVTKLALRARVQSLLKLKNEIDNRKQREKELESLTKRLEELNETKNRFLGTAAHDLRSPLSSIRGFSEFLLEELEGKLDEDQTGMLDMIHDTSSSMLNLVNNLLDVAVIESGKFDLFLEKHSMVKLTESRLQLLSNLAVQKQIALLTDLKPVPETMLDVQRMGQVIDNLISNAIKFSPEKSSVMIKMHEEGGYIHVSISDQGVGISDEDMPKLFGAFQKLGSKPTGGEKSTGLGLSIVKKIVTAHGGDIKADSKEGEGTTMTFTLPVKEQ
ncbi:hybrid sensor histidine kinase/response regulator [Limisalsivibrio acetivorans]|uniref:hybrid sensor histidine kinase/response regulator n=1 Tax=Limisalsivibrio acetivorans TaxID=1304888 RepID=UPI0003B4C1E5|nr:hybrid sensor histidine kinase/response regulator [Limisalsivibrio acetivorans]